MKFVKVGQRVFNLAHVAWAEWSGDDTVIVHFAVPVPESPAGVSYPMNSAPPVGTGHLQMYFSKDEGQRIWDWLVATAEK